MQRYENFARANDDPKLILPINGGDDRWMADLDRSTLFTYLLFVTSEGAVPVIMNCFALAFVSGSISTVCYQLIKHETFMIDATAWAANTSTKSPGSLHAFIDDLGDRAALLISAYAFFPTFLQMGYVVYAVSRWRNFQNTGHSALGAINSTSQLIGAALKQPLTDASKQLAYRCYRYLTAAHILAYKQHCPSPWFKAMALQDLVEVGLLTAAELPFLERMESSKQEVLVSWVAKEMFEGIDSGLLVPSLRVEKTNDVRGGLGTLSANLIVNQPNLWAALMTLVCDLLIVMFVIGNPFTHFIYEMGPFQLYAFLYTLFQSIPYMCAHMLVQTLANPYVGHHDTFNTDSVIAWGERTCFTNLRCKFVGQPEKQKTPNMKSRTPDMKSRTPDKRAGVEPGIELSTNAAGNLVLVPNTLSKEGSDKYGPESESWEAVGALVSALQPASLSPLITPSSPDRAGVTEAVHKGTENSGDLHLRKRMSQQLSFSEKISDDIWA